jgi:hypothetical protein
MRDPTLPFKSTTKTSTTVESADPEPDVVRAQARSNREITERPSRVLPGLHPTIRPFTSDSLVSQPSAGAHSGAPEGCRASRLSCGALSGWGRHIGRGNANAIPAEGNAGVD